MPRPLAPAQDMRSRTCTALSLKRRQWRQKRERRGSRLLKHPANDVANVVRDVTFYKLIPSLSTPFSQKGTFLR